MYSKLLGRICNCREIIQRESVLRIGDTLLNKEDNAQAVLVKSFEMINYGTGKTKLNHIGFSSNISEDEAKKLIGKRLVKE